MCEHRYVQIQRGMWGGCVCVRQKTTPNVLLGMPSTSFVAASHWISRVRLDWLASQFQESPVSTSPALALQGTPPCPAACAWGRSRLCRHMWRLEADVSVFLGHFLLSLLRQSVSESGACQVGSSGQHACFRGPMPVP